MTIQNLAFKITADLTGFSAAMSQVANQFRGAGQQAQQSFRGVTTQVEDATLKMASLGTQIINGVKAFAALQGVRAMVGISDQTLLATARIQSLTGSTEETRQAQEALFEMSQRLQAGYGDAVASFSRMLPAVKELGGGVAETTRLTEILLTTAKLSGASAQEAASSAIQFAQALGSGVLQGDELRSIMENNQTLARTLAEGLGVPLGALRKMGEEGKLTSEMITRVLLGSYDSLKAKAGELPQTVGGAWTQINNAFMIFVSNAGSSTGVFASLAELMGELAKAILAVAAAMGTATNESTKMGANRGALTFGQQAGLAFTVLADIIGSAVSAIVNNLLAWLNALRSVSLMIGSLRSLTAGNFEAAKSQFQQSGQAALDMAERFTKSRDAAVNMWAAINGNGKATTAFIQNMMGPPVTLTGDAPAELKGPNTTDPAAEKAANKAAGASMDVEMDAINKSIEAERKRFAIAQEVATIRTQMDRDRALAAIEAEQRVAKFQLDNQKMTQEQYLAAELVFEERKYGIRRAAVERQLELAKAEGRDPAEVERINAELLALELDFQTRKHQIGLEVEQAAAGGGGKGGGAMGSVWTVATNSMNEALGTMLTRAKTFGQAMSSVWGNLRTAVLSNIMKMIGDMVLMSVKERALTLGTVGRSAVSAAAKAFDAMASIPYVGPVLGAAASVATFAAVMALGSKVPSASQGWDIPGGLNPVTQLHSSEMVLPAEQADVIRRMAGGGGGSYAPPVELKGVSAGEFFIANRRELIAVLKAGRRDMAF